MVVGAEAGGDGEPRGPDEQPERRLGGHGRPGPQELGQHRQLAGLSQQEWLKSLIEAQVDITRELTGSYTSTARSLLK